MFPPCYRETPGRGEKDDRATTLKWVSDDENTETERKQKRGLYTYDISFKVIMTLFVCVY